MIQTTIFTILIAFTLLLSIHAGVTQQWGFCAFFVIAATVWIVALVHLPKGSNDDEDA
jgi:hypothetical protein